MKYAFIILHFFSAILCKAQDSLPKLLLKDFKKDPYMFRDMNFQSIWTDTQLIDSSCSLQSLEKTLYGYNLKYSTIILDGDPIGFSFRCEPKDYNDTSNFFESLYLRDTMNCLIGKNYQHFVKPGDSLMKKYRYILSPFSGLYFGTKGGFIGGHPYRIHYEFAYLSNIVPASEFHILLCSANPYIRILAMEYYLRNKREFRAYRKHILPILEQLSREEYPLTYQYGGCIRRIDTFTASKVFKHYRRNRLIYRYVFTHLDVAHSYN